MNTPDPNLPDNPGPINEPIEMHLARIEAAGQLLHAGPPHCDHCRMLGSVIDVDGNLPRALGFVHETDCPLTDA